MAAHKTICKFRCASVERAFDNAPPGTDKVTLRTTYDEPLTKQDEAFSRYTPWGDMEFGIDNPNLAGFFVQGKDYLITIEPVEKELTL